MTATQINIGDEVKLNETFHGIKWTKIGTAIEISENGMRIRVQWIKWVYESGHEKIDTKRTWVATKRLS